jgi:hypothetical protein
VNDTHLAERTPTAPTAATPDPVPVPDDSPTHFTVLPWWDPDLAASGVDPRDPYVERFWLGTLGPSAVLLLRRFARGLEEHPEGFRVGIADTALALGLGRGTGRNAPINRTVNRAASFGMLRRPGPGRIEARTHLPLLAPRQLQHLPALQRRLHADWVRSRRERPDPGSGSDAA